MHAKKTFIKNPMHSVVGLGVTTTIGYGTLYYSFAILSNEIQDEFGWSKSFIFGIFSLGILIGGFIAPSVGKLLDKHGARGIMSLGSLLAFFGLFGVSQITNEFQYIISIIFLEIISTLVLYEAAFVALAQTKGDNARTSITQITLIAGFASTIFWPLIGYLLTIITWRETYQVLALFHIFLAMPIHFIVLKKDLVVDNTLTKNPMLEIQIDENNRDSKKIFILLAFIFSLIALPVTVMQTHFIGLLNEFGIETAIAIGIGALMGPSQVVARITEMAFTKKISPIISGILAVLAMMIGLFVLLFSGYSPLLATVFVVFYGAGQGLAAIIKGTIPLYIYGKNNYGTINGKLHFYRTIVIAIAPFGFAFLLDNIGAKISVAFLVAVTFTAIVLLITLNKEIHNKDVTYGT